MGSYGDAMKQVFGWVEDGASSQPKDGENECTPPKWMDIVSSELFEEYGRRKTFMDSEYDDAPSGDTERAYQVGSKGGDEGDQESGVKQAWKDWGADDAGGGVGESRVHSKEDGGVARKWSNTQVQHNYSPPGETRTTSKDY